VRLLTEEDFPWLAYIGVLRYGDRWDQKDTENWFRNICMKNTLLFQPIRTDNAFCITMLSVLPWFPSEWEANVIFICAAPNCSWEAVRLLRASVEWARKRKAVKWRCISETEYDLGPMAMRVGATEISPRFEVRL
jgi:hypothetical protein